MRLLDVRLDPHGHKGTKVTDDLDLATTLADGAGRLLLGVQRAADPHEIGTSSLEERGAHLSHAMLVGGLADFRAEDAVLCDGADDDLARLTADRVWIIDPLDGTSEFSTGRHDWAVHVALWDRGELSAAAVALPVLGTILTSESRATTWGIPKRIRLAVPRPAATRTVGALAARLNADLVPLGSVGFAAHALIRGEIDAYVHTGGQHEGGTAAPVAVARALGLFTSRIDGSPLVFNNADPSLPDVLICNPLLADVILSHLRVVTGGEPRVPSSSSTRRSTARSARES